MARFQAIYCIMTVMAGLNRDSLTITRDKKALRHIHLVIFRAKSLIHPI